MPCCRHAHSGFLVKILNSVVPKELGLADLVVCTCSGGLCSPVAVSFKHSRTGFYTLPGGQLAVSDAMRSFAPGSIRFNKLQFRPSPFLAINVLMSNGDVWSTHHQLRPLVHCRLIQPLAHVLWYGACACFLFS